VSFLPKLMWGETPEMAWVPELGEMPYGTLNGGVFKR
jgi:hypothetical protein